MPAATSPYNPPSRSHGCLWGCLILVLILAIPPILAAGYGAWYLQEGYRRDPVLKLVGALVRQDRMAVQVLGHGAAVIGVEGNVFSWTPGLTSDNYDVLLAGPEGQGHLRVKAHHGSFAASKLDSAILTGPDGRRYDLLKHQALSPAGNAYGTAI